MLVNNTYTHIIPKKERNISEDLIHFLLKLFIF